MRSKGITMQKLSDRMAGYLMMRRHLAASVAAMVVLGAIATLLTLAMLAWIAVDAW